MISLGTSILGALFGGKKRSSANVSKAGTVLRGAGRAVDQSQDVGRAKEDVAALQAQRTTLQAEADAKVVELSSADTAAEVTTVETGPTKTGIDVRVASLAFAPFWQAGETTTPAWE